MLKKYLIVLGLVLCCGTTTVWCAPKKVSVWVGMEPVNTFRTLAKEFTKQTGVEVEITEVQTGDMLGQMITAAPVGQGPDLIFGTHDWIGRLALSNCIAPITSKEFPVSLQKEHMPAAVEAMRFNNKLYGFPVTVESMALIYNKALVKTPPKTMEKLVNLAVKLNNPSPQKRCFGFLINVPEFYFSYPIFKAYGGYIFKKTPKGFDYNDVGLANAGSIAGLSFIRDLKFKYKLLPDGINTDILSGLFAEGKCAMIFFGPWNFDRYRQNGIDFGVAGLPTIHGKQIVPFMGVRNLMINAQTKNRPGAIQFARFVASFKGEMALAKNNRYVPSLMKAQQDPYIQNSLDLKGLTEAARSGEPMPNVPEMSQVWEPVRDAILLVLSGESTPKKALLDAKKVIQNGIRDMH